MTATVTRPIWPQNVLKCWHAPTETQEQILSGCRWRDIPGKVDALAQNVIMDLGQWRNLTRQGSLQKTLSAWLELVDNFSSNFGEADELMERLIKSEHRVVRYWRGEAKEEVDGLTQSLAQNLRKVQYLCLEALNQCSLQLPGTCFRDAWTDPLDIRIPSEPDMPFMVVSNWKQEQLPRTYYIFRNHPGLSICHRETRTCLQRLLSLPEQESECLYRAIRIELEGFFVRVKALPIPDISADEAQRLGDPPSFTGCCTLL